MKAVAKMAKDSRTMVSLVDMTVSHGTTTMMDSVTMAKDAAMLTPDERTRRREVTKAARRRNTVTTRRENSSTLRNRGWGFQRTRMRKNARGMTENNQTGMLWDNLYPHNPISALSMPAQLHIWAHS